MHPEGPPGQSSRSSAMSADAVDESPHAFAVNSRGPVRFSAHSASNAHNISAQLGENWDVFSFHRAGQRNLQAHSVGTRHKLSNFELRHVVQKAATVFEVCIHHNHIGFRIASHAHQGLWVETVETT